ncbi:MAG: glycosyltransferase family 4 protein [Verrucomicrobiales bacterium]|nr:glycosyltransferase family 4 protein [Verrucomicrobiales bacterium]
MLEHIHVVTISKSEQAHLAKFFPERTIDYIPFGVDTQFWKPAPDGPVTRKFVLAIGNDANRDWKTLVEAWDETMPPLKIVTNLPVPIAAPNVEVIRGDWRKQTLSDQEILKLYQQALCVVIPLRNTIQPAGQSVCLQAMACGRPVVMSDIAGLWDRTHFVDGQHWWLPPPEAALSLRKTVENVRLRVGSVGISTGINAREIVKKEFSTTKMCSSIGNLLSSI